MPAALHYACTALLLYPALAWRGREEHAAEKPSLRFLRRIVALTANHAKRIAVRDGVTGAGRGKPEESLPSPVFALSFLLLSALSTRIVHLGNGSGAIYQRTPSTPCSCSPHGLLLLGQREGSSSSGLRSGQPSRFASPYHSRRAHQHTGKGSYRCCSHQQSTKRPLARSFGGKGR